MDKPSCKFRYFQLKLTKDLGLSGSLFRTDGQMIESIGTMGSGGRGVWMTHNAECAIVKPEQLFSDLFVEV